MTRAGRPCYACAVEANPGLGDANPLGLGGPCQRGGIVVSSGRDGDVTGGGHRPDARATLVWLAAAVVPDVAGFAAFEGTAAGEGGFEHEPEV